MLRRIQTGDLLTDTSGHLIYVSQLNCVWNATTFSPISFTDIPFDSSRIVLFVNINETLTIQVKIVP